MDSKTEALMESVFGNHLLVENIAKFAITDTKTVQACRLVNSAWLQTVTRYLHYKKEPLFTLNLQGALAPAKLQKFENVVTNSDEHHDLNPLPPPVAIRMNECTLENNYPFVRETLFGYSNTLVSLHLRLPEMGCAELLTAEDIDLPNLREFSLNLGNFSQSGTPAPGGVFVTTLVIQSILSGGTNLKQFTLSGGVNTTYPLPGGFEYLSLPKTLTKVELKRGLEEQYLESLMLARLPKLTSLTLPFGRVPFEDFVVFSILNQYSRTLKHLTLHGINTERKQLQNVAPTIVMFPQMRSLQSLEITAGNVRLAEDNPLSEELPALRSLSFKFLSLAEIQRWLESSVFTTVTRLFIQLDFHFSYISQEDQEDAQRVVNHMVRQSFPNLAECHIAFRPFPHFHWKRPYDNNVIDCKIVY